jgi:hypothetical protein
MKGFFWSCGEWGAFDCRKISAEFDSFVWRGLFCFWFQIGYSNWLDGPELLSIECTGCGQS